MDELEHALGPYAFRAYCYAQRVVAGEQPAGKFVRLACKRFLDDLDRENVPWVFDPDRANHVCEFIETLPHVKGTWASSTIVLEDWQCFVLCVPFGFVYSSDVVAEETGEVIAYAGTRRFKMVYIEVPRKNAKSTISSGVALYMLKYDGETGAEVYSVATKREQAKIVFDAASAMAKRTNLGLQVWKYSIADAETGSVFQPLHSQGHTMDGLNIHCSVNDELHAWKRRDTYSVLETAMGSRRQPLMWNITTAGTNLEGVCYETHTYVKKVLQGVISDDSVFAIIYAIDDEDDWQQESSWRKANPNYGVSVSALDMMRLAKKAKELASDQTGFLTKRLNIWCNASSSWLNILKYQACANPAMRIEDFAGEDCYLGVDLASKNDIAAVAAVFIRKIDGKSHYFAFVKSYLPEAAVKAAANAGHYDGWVRDGWIITTPGEMLDVERIERDTLELSKVVNLKEIAFDPQHNSTQYGLHMMDQGMTVLEVRPTVTNFSDPMLWMEALVAAGQWHHNGDPCMTWMVSNVVTKRDASDRVYPRKEFYERKIDGVVAVLMALNRAMASEREPVWEQDLVVV